MTNTMFLEKLSKLEPGTHRVLPPDCRGDGYDIPCVAREDLTDAILSRLSAGSTVNRWYANGFLCAYEIRVA